jgi:hypothetical protein
MLEPRICSVYTASEVMFLDLAVPGTGLSHVIQLAHQIDAKPCCRWLGIDHVHLWENDSAQPIKAGLQEFIDSGFLTYATHSGDAQQGPVYRICDALYRHKYNWLMYIDADEFLVQRDKCGPTASLYLSVSPERYSDYPGPSKLYLRSVLPNMLTRHATLPGPSTID